MFGGTSYYCLFGLSRHWLNGYPAYWVPSPPGKCTFKNFNNSNTS